MEHFDSRDIEKFNAGISPSDKDECWPWTKARQSAGYGVFVLASTKKQVLSHRFSLALATGGMRQEYALHSCDNPACCNPSHLRWGTQKENVSDAKLRKRHVNPPVVRENPEWEARRLESMPRGEKLHNQSLTEQQAREIMRLHMEGMNVTQIADKVGAKKHVVSDVCRGRSWRHLDGIPTIEEMKTGGVRRGFNQFT